MSGKLAQELLALAERVAAVRRLPPITELYLPPSPVPDHMDGEFGFVVLADGSTGNFFTLLGDTLARLHAADLAARWRHQPVIALARWVLSDDEMERTVGLGAVNAIAQHLFSVTHYTPDAESGALDWFELSAEDHLGMVGYITPWVHRLVAQGVRVTVIEKNSDMLARADGATVTLDPRALGQCNKVLITASTLLNDTLDDVLLACPQAQQIALVGPTASCFPEPLFARGIGLVGGNRIVDAAALLARAGAGERWGDAAFKYTIARADYPGSLALLADVQQELNNV